MLQYYVVTFWKYLQTFEKFYNLKLQDVALTHWIDQKQFLMNLANYRLLIKLWEVNICYDKTGNMWLNKIANHCSMKSIVTCYFDLYLLYMQFALRLMCFLWNVRVKTCNPFILWNKSISGHCVGFVFESWIKVTCAPSSVFGDSVMIV